MLAYLVRRLILALLTVWAISVLSFVIIQLPPGDYITSYIAQMSASGSVVSDAGGGRAARSSTASTSRSTSSTCKWMRQIVQGNFGMAMEWGARSPR